MVDKKETDTLTARLTIGFPYAETHSMTDMYGYTYHSKAGAARHSRALDKEAAPELLKSVFGARSARAPQVALRLLFLLGR